MEDQDKDKKMLRDEIASSRLNAGGTGQQVFTASEAAEYLGIPLATFKYHAYTKKRIPSVMLHAKAAVFRKEDLDAFKDMDIKRGRPSNPPDPDAKPKRRYRRRTPKED